MKIKNLLYAAIAVSAFVFPTIANAETLQDVITQTGDRTYVMTQDEIITQYSNVVSGSSLIIVGNNKTIDGKGNNGFTVKSEQKFELTNTAAKNFVKDAWGIYGSGAVVYNEGIIENFSGIFENNYADDFGGVIFNNNSGKINTINGIFKNNASYDDGGAICNKADINIINGTFNNNKTEQYGGAIYNEANINIINANFNSNSTAQYGGGIYNLATIGSISGSFDSNSAKEGGAIYNRNTITSIEANFTNNTVTRGYGAAIHNGNNATIENISGTFENNFSEGEAGAIYNDSVINTINASFKNNKSVYGGGAIYNSDKIDTIAGIFDGNISEENGGAIYSYGTIAYITGTFINNKANLLGGAIYNDFGIISAIEGVFKNNKANVLGGAIINFGGITNIVANENDTIFTGNKDITGNNAYTNVEGLTNINAKENKSIVFNDSIGITPEDYINASKQINPDISEEDYADLIEEAEYYTDSTKSNLNINASKENIKPVLKNFMYNSWGIDEESFNNLKEDEKEEFYDLLEEAYQGLNLLIGSSGTIEFNNKVKNQTVNMFDGTLKFGTNVQDGTKYVGELVNSNFNYYGGLVTLQNNGINSANLGNMTLHNEMNLSLDADLKAGKIDTISADSFTSNDNKINIDNINLLSATDKKELYLSPLSADMDSATRQTMADSIIYSGGEVAYGNIYKYSVDYDPRTANLKFGLLSGGNTLTDFAPAVVSNPVAQNGAQTIQLDSFSEAFKNMDTFMLMPENERLAYKYRNKYASLSSDLVYDPTMSTYQNNTGWFRPYTTFENIPLKNGPKVSNVTYGSFFGYDSALHELGKGWDGTLGVYAGYTGSHQSFNGSSVYQNGGTLGVLGVAYKGNFFTGLTANIGATAGSTTNIQGSDNFTAVMGGLSSKTGYNIELANGKVILQPSMIMSYSLVNTFDYTNASGLRMKSDPYHTLQLEPGLKVIGNIGTWQPYANVSMVWNVLNAQKIMADNVRLPKYEVKPYVKYGVGLQKRWGEKFTAYGQAYVTNGGRNGVGLQAGLRIAIGDETVKSKAAWLNPKKKDTIIVLDGKVK